MNKYIKGMFIACLFYPIAATAQNSLDALRYSQQTFGSTARSLSMGGAFGALGADFSSLGTNPAGIGLYKKSEFTFSLGFNNRSTESSFGEEVNSADRFTVDVPNLGLVFAFNKKREEGWKQFGFGLGYHRTANFNSEIFYEGKNNDNSILDAFTDVIYNAGGATTDDLYYDYAFDAYLAYQTYLLNPDSINPYFYNTVIPNGGITQSRRTTTRGGMGEFSLAFGGNFSEKIFFGIDLAFPTVRYEEETVYREEDKNNAVSVADTLNFKSLRYDTYLNTSGNGFNAKFGVIVKPADWVRIGAAIHTPTWYFMSDSYYSSMSSVFEGGGYSSSWDSPDGVFSYDLKTPYRAIGSLAFVIGKFALLSFDYELTDYSSSKLDAGDYSFSDENRVIREVYSGFASNYRGGLEVKYENFAFRLGAAYYSTPFDSKYSESGTDQHVISYTGGVGYRAKRFFLDIGFARSERSEFYTPYTLSYEGVQGSVQDRTDTRVITTLGVRF